LEDAFRNGLVVLEEHLDDQVGVENLVVESLRQQPRRLVGKW
jgi:hypothetical protein